VRSEARRAAVIGGARLLKDLKDYASSLAFRLQNMSHVQTRAEPWPAGNTARRVHRPSTRNPGETLLFLSTM
jgi:hypothetical protein